MLKKPGAQVVGDAYIEGAAAAGHNVSEIAPLLHWGRLTDWAGR